jgi:hypothetical protein
MNSIIFLLHRLAAVAEGAGLGEDGAGLLLGSGRDNSTRSIRRTGAGDLGGKLSNRGASAVAWAP